MTKTQQWKGDWNRVAGNVKEKYGEINNDELRQVEGNADQLTGLIQQKTGQAREQIEAYVDALFRGEGSVTQRATELVQEYAESTRRAVQEGYQQVSQRARRGYEQSTEMVADRPMESIIAALGVGLITGIAIGMSIASRRAPEPSWRDRWTS